MESPKTKNRLMVLDTMKGILIVLVVLGHCGTTLSTELLSTIYAFHMPLFVMISGYLSKRSHTNLIVGRKRLIILYLIFNTLYIILDVLTEGFSLHRLLVPSFALWYILSLVYWRITLSIMPQKWMNATNIVIGVSFLLSLLVGFIPIGSEMSFQRAIVFWPFFIIGYNLKQYDGIRWLRRQNRWIAGLFLATLLLAAYKYMPPFYGNVPYEKNMILTGISLRAVQLAMAVAICGTVITLTPEKLGKITDLGKYIYLLHPPIVKILKIVMSKMGYQHGILTAILITAFTVVLIYNLKKFQIFKHIV